MFYIADALALAVGRCVVLTGLCRSILVQGRDHLASRPPGPVGCTHIRHPFMDCGELLALVEKEVAELPAPELTAMAAGIRAQHLPTLQGAETLLKCVWRPMGGGPESPLFGVLTGDDRVTTTIESRRLRVPIPGTADHVLWELLDTEDLLTLERRLQDASDALVLLVHGIRMRLPIRPG